MFMLNDELSGAARDYEKNAMLFRVRSNDGFADTIPIIYSPPSEKPFEIFRLMFEESD